MIPVSHVLKMTLENLKNPSFPKLGKTLKLCYNPNGTMFTITEKSRSNVFCNKQKAYKAIMFLNKNFTYLSITVENRTQLPTMEKELLPIV